MTIKESMEKDGWIFEDFYCFKKVGAFEVDIEFCLGDCCVGVYRDDNKDLLEPKIRCEDFIQAFLMATILIEKYGTTSIPENDPGHSGSSTT